MTYPCATEGCGEPIEWSNTAGKWFHKTVYSGYERYSRASPGGNWCVAGIAHPAGGTNTTPPEELTPTYVHHKCDERILQLDREKADLRAQLEEALVPKFKVGERVSVPSGEVVVVYDTHVCHKTVSDEDGGVYNYPESDLSPLPEEVKCQHRDVYGNRWEGQTMWGKPFSHCPDCGEPLTTGGGE